MKRPYDDRLSQLMISTTNYLAQETNACMSYTQSDEISLAWYSTNFDSQIFFDGKIQKMVSVLTSMCTAFFNAWVPKSFPEWSHWPLATFDCRIWNVPNTTEGANVFLWREKDATKNAISMAARSVYDHKELDNKNGSEMQEMLWQKGINFNNYPTFFKRGTFIQRRTQQKKFTTEEIDKLPPKHEARSNPNLMIERPKYITLDMPPFVKVTNRPEVIFEGAEPISQKVVT